LASAKVQIQKPFITSNVVFANADGKNNIKKYSNTKIQSAIGIWSNCQVVLIGIEFMNEVG
jgi:hypothetical protein